MTIDKGIFIRNIYYMLTYAFQELKQNNYEEIAGEEFDEIHDLFAEILLRGISFQLKQGLHKEYISCHGSLSTLKGKLDICIIRKSKFPWFPERSVQFSGKRTKRSVQKKRLHTTLIKPEQKVNEDLCSGFIVS